MTRTSSVVTRRKLSFALGVFLSLSAWGDVTTLGISDASITTAATPTTLDFGVTRSGDTSYDAYLTYHTVNGTAVAGTDFTGVTGGVVKIAAGASTGNIPITVAANTSGGADKTMQVVLDRSAG